MEKTVIYYFSGTGNSLVVARDITAKLGGELISIPSVMEKKDIITDADVIGIVFPVYHAIIDGLPLIIERFAGKLENLNGKYIFAVNTCKGWSRLAISKLAEIIKSRGGKLAAGFTVVMPDNTAPTTPEKHRKAYNKWKKTKLGEVSRYVSARKRGKYENTTLYNVIMAPLTASLKKTTMKLMYQLSGTSGITFREALPLTDRSFNADEKCNGCGTCLKVCPVNNIVLVDKKPVWQNHCESCMACLNWCPKEAISGGIATTGTKTERYHHQDVKVSDFIVRDK